MINILYIAGAGRSGSTLLERILGQIDGVVNIGELRHVWHRSPTAQRCGCGEILGECTFWKEVMAQTEFSLTTEGFAGLSAAQHQMNRLRYVPGVLKKPLGDDKYIRNQIIYTGTVHKIYAAIHDLTGCHTIVDASKDIPTLNLLREMTDLRLRVLHLVRDSRAVAYSWTREKKQAHHVGEIGYMDRHSPHRSALEWIYRNQLTEMACDRVDGYIRVRYEELIADPLEVIGRVAHFIGLSEPDLRFINGVEVQFSKENHALVGNPMRFQKGAVKLKVDNAWQHELKKTDKAIVTALTWPMLHRYDYL